MIEDEDNDLGKNPITALFISINKTKMASQNTKQRICFTDFYHISKILDYFM